MHTYSLSYFLAPHTYIHLWVNPTINIDALQRNLQKGSQICFHIWDDHVTRHNLIITTPGNPKIFHFWSSLHNSVCSEDHVANPVRDPHHDLYVTVTIRHKYFWRNLHRPYQLYRVRKYKLLFSILLLTVFQKGSSTLACQSRVLFLSWIYTFLAELP